jgi:hypothetical protein
MDRSENGLVIVADASGVPSAQAFIGFALDAASGTAGTQIEVLIPTPDDLFIASLASAEDTFVAPDVDNIGTLGGLIFMNAANNSVVAVDEGNTNWVYIEDIYGGDIVKRGGEIGSSYPTMTAGDRVVFRFLNSVLDTAGSQA